MPDTALSPDYANENKGPVILAIVWVLTLTAGLFVGLRLTVRIVKLRRLRVDDGIMAVSQILGFVFLGFVTAAVHDGAGRHSAVLAKPQVQAASMYITLGFVPGIISFGLPKLAVISLLTQLLAPSRLHAALLWTFGATCLVLLVACIAWTFAQCDPPRAMWTFDIPGAKCSDPGATVPISVAAGSFSAFLDLYLAVYPAIVLWQLQMRLLRKFALSVALGLGAFASAISIYKCTTIPGVANKPDFTSGTVGLIIWTSIEANCVIIAACIPTLAPLLDIILGWNPLHPRIPSPTHVYNTYVRRHGAPKPMELQTRSSGTAPEVAELDQRRHSTQLQTESKDWTLREDLTGEAGNQVSVSESIHGATNMPPAP